MDPQRKLQKYKQITILQSDAGCSGLQYSQQHSGQAQGDVASQLNQILIIELKCDQYIDPTTLKSNFRVQYLINFTLDSS